MVEPGRAKPPSVFPPDFCAGPDTPRLDDDAVTDESCLFRPAPGRRGRDRRQVLLFFLPGNPGLYQYYLPFLYHLRALLQQTEAHHAVAFTLAAQSLQGFLGLAGRPPYSLAAQIAAMDARLLALTSPRPPTAPPYDDVVVVGHSLGAYLTVELFHRHLDDGTPPVPLRAGIGLFATVTHLAASSSGRAAAALLRVPVLADHAWRAPALLLALLPAWLVCSLVAWVLAFPPEAAAVTAAWLKSPGALRQAYSLARDELATIRGDVWREDVWEVVDREGERGGGQPDGPPKFIFYFAEKDHWVADETRAEFIRQREEHAAREGVPRHKRGRTKQMIDHAKIPHSFCIRKSSACSSCWSMTPTLGDGC